MSERELPTVIRLSPLSRRAVLQAFGAAAGAVSVWPYLSDTAAEAFSAIQGTSAPAKLAYFTPERYATVDALAEAIIPTDNHSPGARAARVADYIDLLLAESDPQTQQTWEAGLVALDDECRRRFGASFSGLASAQALQLLADISRSEFSPQTTLEQFFAATKSATIRGYYTSQIGIHQELEYKGNKILRDFVGCTHGEHGYQSAS